VFLMGGLFVGCPDKPEDEWTIVAERYRGTYEGTWLITGGGGTNRFQIVLSKEKLEFYQYLSNKWHLEQSYKARVSENELYIIVPADDRDQWLDNKKQAEEAKI